MGTKSTKTTRKPTAAKKLAPLEICPTNGAGWCSFPFSPAQLEKRRKKAEVAVEQPAERQLVRSRSGK